MKFTEDADVQELVNEVAKQDDQKFAIIGDTGDYIHVIFKADPLTAMKMLVSFENNVQAYLKKTGFEYDDLKEIVKQSFISKIEG